MRTAKAHAARSQVAYAVKTGKLVKPDKCEQCSQSLPLEAAHDDYDKPLQIVWLCIPCHRAWDKAHPKGGTVESQEPKLQELRNRIVEYKTLPAGEILGHEDNWRTHGDRQSRAVEESLQELGFYDPLKVYITDEGKYKLCDGHLRQKLIEARVGPETQIPVVVIDFDEAEAKKALLTHDPLASLAGADAGKLESLMKEVATDGDATAKMLADLAADNKIDWGEIAAANPGITHATGVATGHVVEDEVPEPPKEPVTRPGDLWLLGAYFECESCGKKYSYEEGKSLGECPCG